MQYTPLLHRHSSPLPTSENPFGAINHDTPPNLAWQDFFDTLTDPSLHTNVSPWQCEIPPLRPLQGLFAACTGIENRASPTHSAVNIRNTSKQWRFISTLFTPTIRPPTT